MGFEKTKEVAESHSEEEIQAEESETKDLKPTEEAESESDLSEETSTDGEEDTSTNETSDDSIEYWKGHAQKMESERDNYKQGMLSAKAKKRNLEEDAPHSEQVDLNESVVLEVLGKQSEKKALQNTIDAKHTDYIPELVDDAKYNEIIAYLPRNIDKSDYGSIVKSLKLATRLWKEDKGIKDQVKKPISAPGSKTTTASGSIPSKPKQFERKFFKSNSLMSGWYDKK